MKKKEKNNKWTKFTERECDLFTVVCILSGYTKIFKKHIGLNFKNFLVVYKNGIVNSYRDSAEYENMLQRVKKKKTEFLKILNKLEKQNKLLKQFLAYRDFKDFSDKDLLTLFEKFVKVYQEYFSLFTLPKYYGMVFKRNQLSKAVKDKLKLLRGTAYYEDAQDKFIPSFFKEIGKRKNVDFKLLFYALPEEIIELLSNKKRVDKNLLKSRKKYSVVFVKNSKFNLYIKEKAKKIEIDQLDFVKQEKTSIVTGRVAYIGNVTGEVKIVMRKDDLKNIDGKIIVTPMTSIRFVPFIKKVKAIITDEGGIACHAAIISREFKIPCIIGTKIATKVLKDGDLVEIDSVKGEIRKIK